MEEPTQNTAHRPGLGAFLTMIFGLLVFFGLVSRIGKVNPDGNMLSSVSANAGEAAMTANDEARQRSAAVFGTRQQEVAVVPATVRAKPAAKPAVLEAQPVAPPQQLQQPPQPQAAPQQPAPQPAPQPQTAPQNSRQRFYVVQPGDTYWGIAQKVYGDGGLHGLLEEANHFATSGLPAGATIVVPPADSARSVSR